MSKKQTPDQSQIDAVIDLIDRETSLYSSNDDICPPRIIALRKFAASLKGK